MSQATRGCLFDITTFLQYPVDADMIFRVPIARKDLLLFLYLPPS